MSGGEDDDLEAHVELHASVVVVVAQETLVKNGKIMNINYIITLLHIWDPGFLELLRPRILETKTRMNGQGRKAIPIQLDPSDKSDASEIFREAQGGHP